MKFQKAGEFLPELYEAEFGRVIIEEDGELYYFCAKCGEELEYSVDDDCLYCEICNEWKEKKCSDSDCQFCTNRPEKPSARLPCEE
jgi:hypothetical protein